MMKMNLKLLPFLAASFLTLTSYAQQAATPSCPMLKDLPQFTNAAKFDNNWRLMSNPSYSSTAASFSSSLASSGGDAINLANKTLLGLQQKNPTYQPPYPSSSSTDYYFCNYSLALKSPIKMSLTYIIEKSENNASNNTSNKS